MTIMTSNYNDSNEKTDKKTLYDGPSKSQLKRESHHLIDVGEEILKLFDNMNQIK